MPLKIKERLSDTTNISNMEKLLGKRNQNVNVAYLWLVKLQVVYFFLFNLLNILQQTFIAFENRKKNVYFKFLKKLDLIKKTSRRLKNMRKINMAQKLKANNRPTIFFYLQERKATKMWLPKEQMIFLWFVLELQSN